nr:hypothetical protein [uncultured Mitsuokella sp.]
MAGRNFANPVESKISKDSPSLIYPKSAPRLVQQGFQGISPSQRGGETPAFTIRTAKVVASGEK